MNKESFVFYSSWYDALKNLKSSERVKVYDAICELAIAENEKKLDGIAKTIYTLIKPQIVANARRYENGKKGGRPKKETIGYENEETKTKPIGYENEETKTKPNVNVNDNVNVKKKEIYKERKNIYDYLQENFGCVVGGSHFYKIEELLKTYEEEILMYAVDLCVGANKTNLNYFYGILNNWISSGYKTLEEIKSGGIGCEKRMKGRREL